MKYLYNNFLFFSHFKRFINIFVEFIPQVLFLMSLFGWLVFLIFFKWCYRYDDPNTVSILPIAPLSSSE